MHINNNLTQAIRLATTLGAVSAFTLSYSATAEQNETAASNVERIAVTGSSIKRTDVEGSLPVQVLSRAEIDASGITNAGELIQSLPAMQGFTVAAQSVGGGGGGVKTASLRGLGADYTLVLLNGRRLAPRGSGSSIDLNSIPLAAIERVEILTDGASAIYGSDAIAGVVNFITKNDMQNFNVSLRYNKPEQKGGDGYNVSFTGGFGDYEADGYNVIFSLSRDDQNPIKAVDRDFAKTGIIPFRRNNTDYFFVQGSTNGIPGNAQLNFQDPNVEGAAGRSSRIFSPYYARNGSCPMDTFFEEASSECSWDFQTSLEIYPENDRTAALIGGEFKVSDHFKLFASGNFSEYSETNRIAPYPTGFFPLPMDSALVTEWVLPHLTDEEKALTLTRVDARWRALPVGARATNWTTKSTHLVAGFEGDFRDIDYSGAFTHSVNNAEENFVGGWLLSEEFQNTVGSGVVNVFDTPDQLTPEAKTALDATVYNGHWTTSKTVVNALDFKASAPVYELDAGMVYLGAGAEYRQTKYTNSISDTNEQELILFLSRGTAYDLNRDAYGVFAELIAPVTNDLEVTAALRYDSVGKVTNGNEYNDEGFPIPGSPSFTVNETESDVTYKISARYQATDDILFRASYGTGFKAPSMLAIAQPRVPAGVTGGGYACPFPVGDPLQPLCLTGPSQYGVFNQGSPDLKPETSVQYNAGIVYAPSRDFSIGLDYWRVDLEDRVTSLTESQIFGNPERFRHLFTGQRNLATGDDELAIIRSSVNVGSSKNAGLDWDIMVANDLPIGRLRTTFSGTYMLESQYTLPGTDDEWVTSLGRFGDDQNVVFRTIFRFANTLTHGEFAHTLALQYRSGYDDRAVPAAGASVRQGSVTGPGVPMQLSVPSYSTINYQTRYTGMDSLAITLGVNNLGDRPPPLSLRGGQGHMIGYDHRYTDAFGRTYYLNLEYSF